jgi:hypothetical protein
MLKTKEKKFKISETLSEADRIFLVRVTDQREVSVTLKGLLSYENSNDADIALSDLVSHIKKASIS